MTAFAAGTLKNDVIKPIILQAAKVDCGEKSEDTVNIMQEILEDGKEYLQRLRETCERVYPDFIHDIPLPSAVTLANCKKTVLTTDACNQAQLSRRLAIDETSKAHDELEEGMCCKIVLNILLMHVLL